MKCRRILIDIGHPAQVHHFKNLYWELEKLGWECIFTAKQKEMSFYLLKKYGLNYIEIGSAKKSLIRKISHLLVNEYKFMKAVIQFKPDLIFSRSSAHSAHISKILRIPHVGFSDTESATLLDRITEPFINMKITGNSYKKRLGKNHFFFNGNVELAYLHPNRFKPDPSILNYLGVKPDETYVIMRFVSWNAHHDVGLNGLSVDMKIKAVKTISEYAKVFITSEDKLPNELNRYKITIPPERMHHALAFASLLYGESATMASECACLGVPAIYLDNVGRGYTDEEELFGLVYNFTHSIQDQEASISKAVEILTIPEGKKIWRENLKQYISKKIDVTAFMVWIAENYPQCIDILRNNPDFPDQFKAVYTKDLID